MRIVKSDMELLGENLDIYDYNWGIRPYRFWLKCYGLWPNYSEKSDRIISKIVFSFMVSFITMTTVLPEAAAVVVTWGNLDIFMISGFPVFVFALIVVKLFIMLYKQKGLLMIFEMSAEDWNDNLSAEEKLILVNSYRLSKKLGIIGNSLAIGSVFLYHGPVLFELGFTLRIQSNLTDMPGRILTFMAIYPFDINSIYVYKFIVLMQCMGAVVAVIASTLTDILFSNIVLHAASLTKNLCLKINNINCNENNKNLTQILGPIIKRHCRIIE